MHFAAATMVSIGASTSGSMQPTAPVSKRHVCNKVCCVLAVKHHNTFHAEGHLYVQLTSKQTIVQSWSATAIALPFITGTGESRPFTSIVEVYRQLVSSYKTL